MQSFEYNSNPARVIFGSGTIKQLPSEIKRLNKLKPLLLSTPTRAEQVKELIPILENGSITAAGLYSKAVMHTPTHITSDAVKYVEQCQADSVISVGGGSTIGLGKAISIRTGIPHICVPSTYAGSEMTPILGETADGRKQTRSDKAILPATVIYDVDYTLTMPAALSATSGINAIAHAVEALYAANTNPIINTLALEGIRALTESLPIVVREPNDQDARSKSLYGAWLCATCLGSVGMALHHKLCHTLGGSFNLPHADTHTAVLPHALAYNAPAIPEVMAKLVDVLPGSDGDAIRGMNKLVAALNVKRGLKDFGMQEGDIDKAAEIATSNPYYNPRAIEKEPLKETIRRCWAGEEARADV